MAGGRGEAKSMTDFSANPTGDSPNPPRFPLVADAIFGFAALALGYFLFHQKGIWREAVVGTSLAGAISLLLFRQTVEWRQGRLARWRTAALYAMAAVMCLSASSVLDYKVIDAGSDYRVPFQLPGPMDHWAEGMATEITVDTSGTRGALVTLNLHESHDAFPPTILVLAGKCEVERFEVRPGNGALFPNWREKGLASEYPVVIPEECLSPANNKVIFRPIGGSWIAVKSVSILDLPHRWEPWRQVAQPWNWIFFWLSLALIALDAILAWPRAQTVKRALFGAGMGMMILTAIVAMLAGMATYVEIRHRWMVKREGEFRSGEMFYGSKFIRDAELGWRLLPGFVGKTLDTGGGSPALFYSVNKHGFRALAEETDFPPKGKAMVLGDSFAQGLFLTQEETIPAVMARSMGGYVYNFGVGGFSTDQEYTTFIKWVDRVDAEAVVLLFYANDVLFTEARMGHGFQKPAYSIVDGRVDFSRLEKLPATLVETENAKLLANPEMEKTFCCFTRKHPGVAARIARKTASYAWELYYPGRLLASISADVAKTKAIPAPRHMDVTADLLENPGRYAKQMGIVAQFMVRINEECKKRGKKFLVVFIPDILQITQPDKPALGAFRDTFAKVCAAHGLPPLDPSEELTAKNRWNGTYFLDDGHFSPYGAQIVGDMIADALKKK